uniref:Putative ovule protein n=1 Tax=Solanum chacoense TaxID=4108 RepID=A0A0V0H1G5_SOLCH
MGNPVTGSPSSWVDQVEEKAMLEKKSGESHLSPPSSAHSWSKIVGKGEATEGFDLTGSKGVSNVKITLETLRKKWNTGIQQ